jgi:KDO2-lipid IV(A) lauroyltransferase
MARLPLRVLYIISDGLYFLIYYVARYRVAVVKDNIRRSFPERSEREHLRIEKAFYHHFADIFVESIKMLRMTPEQLSEKIPLSNPEILDKYREAGRSVVAVGAHYCNWEWTVGIVPHLKYKTIGVYKPLNNKRFDVVVNKTRTKFNTEFVSMRDVIRVLVKNKKENIPTFNVFVADQSPVWQEIQYWMPFLNQLSPVYLGPEKLAKQFNMVVFYGNVTKTARGKYNMELILLEENPTQTPDYEITGKFIKILEKTIIEKPEYWLWSHRRWKHTRRREKQESEGIFRFSADNTRI